MGFPIFSLPCLVSSNIVSITGPQELFSLSLCSRKSKSYVKRFFKKTDLWSLVVCAGEYNHVMIDIRRKDFCLAGSKNQSETPSEIDGYMEIGEALVPFKKDTHFYFCTFWNNELVGVMYIAEHVSRLFSLPIHDLSFDRKSLHFLDWINNRDQTPLREVNFEEDSTVTENEFKYLLSNHNSSEELQLFTSPPKSFKTELKFAKNLRKLDINPSYWVTIENLLELDVVYMTIENSELKSSDINRFLKHWLNGGSSRTTCMVVELNGPVVGFQLLDGIEVDRVDDESSRTYTFLDNEDSTTFHGGLDIARRDGVTATIISGGGCVNFLVWPDWKNRTHHVIQNS
ncbi:unnamed protein product [Caenorhabditis brenneri]